MANSFKVKTQNNIGATGTRANGYFVPASTSTTIIGLTLANRTDAAVLGTVQLHNGKSASGGDKTHLIKSAPIPAGSALVVVGGDQKVVLQNAHGVIISSNTASSIDATMSILEIS